MAGSHGHGHAPAALVPSCQALELFLFFVLSWSKDDSRFPSSSLFPL